MLDLVVPTEQSRREILRRHLIGLPLRGDEEMPVADNAGSLASRLATLTGGYVAKDLVRICRNAAAQAHAESIDNGRSMGRPSVGWAELLHAQQQVKPSQLRELNVASPGAPVDGKLVFAGYAAVQKQLFDFVSWKFHPTEAMNVRLLHRLAVLRYFTNGNLCSVWGSPTRLEFCCQAPQVAERHCWYRRWQLRLR